MSVQKHFIPIRAASLESIISRPVRLYSPVRIGTDVGSRIDQDQVCGLSWFRGRRLLFSTWTDDEGELRKTNVNFMRELRGSSTRRVSARRFHAFSAFQPRFLTFFLPPPPFVLLLMDRRLELLPPRPPPLLPIHLPQHSPLQHAEKHVCSHKTLLLHTKSNCCK